MVVTEPVILEYASAQGPTRRFCLQGDGECFCLAYGPFMKMTVGQFGEVASIVTGKPKRDFIVCGDPLHAFIKTFDTKVKQKEADMDIWVSETSGKNYPPPAEGLHQAVCSAVDDLGQVEGAYGTKHMIRISWQLNEQTAGVRTDGKRHTVSKRYTLSLNERANLRKDLEVWRKKKFTTEELAKFNVGVLEGVNANLQIIHRAVEDGRVFGNVQAVLPPPSGEKMSAVKYEEQAPKAAYEPDEVAF